MIKQDDSYKLFNEARRARQIVDGDYITIELSSKGRIYAPPKFHIKNFTVREVLDISLSEDREVPFKVFNYLSTKILEKDVILGSFTKEEYIETLFNFFKVFYTSVIRGHKYIPQEVDISYLASMHGGPTSPDFLRLKQDLDNGIWEPHVDIDLNTIKTYEIPDNFIKEVTIKNNAQGFSYTYGLPCYKDLRDIEDFLDIIFQEEIRKLEPVEKLIKLRNDKLKKRMEGEDIPINTIPVLPKNLERQYNDFMYRRQMIYTKAAQAAYLKAINGKDGSRCDIEEKMRLISDPKFSLKYYTEFIEKIKDQKIGLKKDLQVISPITNAPVSYNFSLDSLVALRPYETANLLELIVSLSKNTANSVEAILGMQMDKVLGLHNTLANLAEKEKEASEKQKDEQMKSANGMMKNPGFNMSNVQSQMNRMTSGIKMPQGIQMPSMGNMHL